MVPRLLTLLSAVLLFVPAFRVPTLRAVEPAIDVVADLPYKAVGTGGDYEAARCRLDVYAPPGAKNLPCLVWLHGGGLTGGSKSDPGTRAICLALASDGLVVASVEYRLSPAAKYPAYVEDAAAAVAWVEQNAAQHGGDPSRVFLGGHSAGGYLTALVALDGHYLRAAGVDPAGLAGFIPISGQMITHFTVRKERGIPDTKILVDDAAPLAHVRADTAPWLVLYADHDMPLRADENRYFVAALAQAGHRGVAAHEIAGRTHGTVAEWIAHPHDPVRELIAAFVHHPG